MGLGKWLFGSKPEKRIPPDPDDYDATPVDEFETTIAGTRHAKGAQRRIPEQDIGTDIWLIREADNPHDRNAVAVFDQEHALLGYLPAHVAAELAPKLDNGAVASARIAGILEPDDRIDLWNLRLRIRVYKD